MRLIYTNRHIHVKVVAVVEVRVVATVMRIITTMKITFIFIDFAKHGVLNLS